MYYVLYLTCIVICFADEEALMLPKRSSSQFKSSSIISGFERARLSPSHFPTLLEEQLLIYKRPGSVESLESFDPVNSVSDHVMSGAEAASKAEAVEESKFYDRFPSMQCQSKVRGRFRKILWPSQNR